MSPFSKFFGQNFWKKNTVFQDEILVWKSSSRLLSESINFWRGILLLSRQIRVYLRGILNSMSCEYFCVWDWLANCIILRSRIIIIVKYWNYLTRSSWAVMLMELYYVGPKGLDGDLVHFLLAILVQLNLQVDWMNLHSQN